MKLSHAAAIATLTLVLTGCNRDNTSSPTLSERTDRFKDNVRERMHPSERITLEESPDDTYQPSAAGSATTYRSNYQRDTYRRDPNRNYRTDVETPR